MFVCYCYLFLVFFDLFCCVLFVVVAVVFDVCCLCLLCLMSWVVCLQIVDWGLCLVALCCVWLYCVCLANSYISCLLCLIDVFVDVLGGYSLFLLSIVCFVVCLSFVFHVRVYDVSVVC